MAAGRVLVCVLAILVVAVPAFAQPPKRPVAIVNLDLTGDGELLALAKQLELALDTHDQLRPFYVTATWDRITDPDRKPMQEAQARLDEAIGFLGNGEYARALEAATRGQALLRTVTPQQATRLYAELAIIRGKALIGDGKPAQAQAAFTLAQRLNPARTLDTAREPPDVVDVFAKAAPQDRPTGRLEVKGEGIVWIDGVDRGRAPSQFVVPAGLHVVARTTVELETGAVEIDVQPGADAITPADIPEVSASQDLQVERARKDLAVAADAAQRLVAMKRLARIINVKDALLIWQRDGKVNYQAWRSDDAAVAPGFSATRERGPKDLPVVMFKDLAPPVEDPDDGIVVYPIPPDTTRWYQKPAYWAGIGFGSALVAVGVYFLATTLQPDSFKGPGDITGLSGQLGRK